MPEMESPKLPTDMEDEVGPDLPTLDELVEDDEFPDEDDDEEGDDEEGLDDEEE